MPDDMRMELNRGGRHSTPGRLAFSRRLVLVLAPALVLTVASEFPVLTTETFFVGVNGVVVLSFVGLGYYLLAEHAERFSGWCFIAAGAAWVVLALDVHRPWGPPVAWLVGSNRSRMLALTFVETLPRERTPESLTGYVRSALSDPTAELLFVVPDRHYLIDGAGRPRELSGPEADQRFVQSIFGSGGQRVAVLLAHPRLREDRTAVGSFARVLSIVAENQQLHAVQRMRLAQLNASRTAERLAYDRAREQFHRDLHDGVQQTIAAARMDLDGILDGAVDGANDGAIDRPGVEASLELAVAEVDGKLKLALDQIRGLKRGDAP